MKIEIRIDGLIYNDIIFFQYISVNALSDVRVWVRRRSYIIYTYTHALVLNLPSSFYVWTSNKIPMEMFVMSYTVRRKRFSRAEYKFVYGDMYITQ